MSVKLYVTAGSPWCEKARSLLTAKGVRFEEIDVARDARRLGELVAVSGQRGVPVVTDGTAVVIGFDEAAIAALAAKARASA